GTARRVPVPGSDPRRPPRGRSRLGSADMAAPPAGRALPLHRHGGDLPAAGPHHRMDAGGRERPGGAVNKTARGTAGSPRGPQAYRPWHCTETTMSKHRRDRRRPGGGEGDREVNFGIVPESPTCSRVGVAISRGGKVKTVIASDEARTLAEELKDADPRASAALKEVAAGVDEMVQKQQLRGHAIPGQILPVRPKITGPEALRSWTNRFRDLARAAFREARRQGASADVVVWAMPLTESLDDEPRGFELLSQTKARQRLDGVGLTGLSPA